MVAFKAHFDGKVLIPDEPLDLPRGQSLVVRVETDESHPQAAAPDAIKLLESLAGSVQMPADWSEQHDHYLYGTPKRPGTDESR